MDDTMHELTLALRQFASDRDWEQFHAPKNLAMALMVEAGELAEHFQWLTPAQSETLSSTQQAEVADELADVFLYLLRLADRLDVNLVVAARAKMIKNAQKYPAEQVRGSAKKYASLPSSASEK